MNELTVAVLKVLNDRHYKFEDGLIERVELIFTDGVLGKQVRLDIEAKDNRSSDGWGQVTFEFRGVELFHLLEDHTTNVVLGGIEWKAAEPGWMADFSPFHSDNVSSTFVIEAHEVWSQSTPNIESV